MTDIYKIENENVALFGQAVGQLAATDSKLQSEVRQSCQIVSATELYYHTSATSSRNLVDLAVKFGTKLAQGIYNR